MMECSIGGALELGRGFRYKEMIVMPLQNCSVLSVSRLRQRRGNGIPTDIFASGIELIEMVQVGEGTEIYDFSLIRG